MPHGASTAARDKAVEAATARCATRLDRPLSLLALGDPAPSAGVSVTLGVRMENRPPLEVTDGGPALPAVALAMAMASTDNDRVDRVRGVGGLAMSAARRSVTRE